MAEESSRVWTDRYEVVFAPDVAKDIQRRWRLLKDDCRMMSNRILQIWRQWHEDKGHPAMLAKWWREGREKPKGEREKAPIGPKDCVPPELSKRIRDTLHSEFYHVYGRIVELLVNTTLKTLKEKKDADGWMKGWVAVLLGRQSQDSFERWQPIPFDKNSMAEILPPLEDNGNFRLKVRMNRFRQENGVSGSVVDVVELRTGYKDKTGKWVIPKKLKSQYSRMKRIFAGEYEFKGSKLVFNERKNKWFAMLCYKQPAPDAVEMEEGSVARLVPGAKEPLRLSLRGGRRPYAFVGGYGQYVTHQRQQLLRGVRVRRESQTYASSSRRGHGYRKAMGAIAKLKRRWSHFTGQCNSRWAAQVAKICRDRGIAKVMYYQPHCDRITGSRFLSTTGKEGKRDSSLWDWYALGVRLQNAAKKHCPGLEVEVVKWEPKVASGSKKKPKKRRKK